MSKFRVGDHVEVNPSPVVGHYDISTVMPFTTVIAEVDDGYGDYFDGTWCLREDMLRLVERPGCGDVIEFEDIRVGDTVRRVHETGGVEHTTTATVDRRSDVVLHTAPGYSLYDFLDAVWYLVRRPEASVDPEVQAIIDAIGDEFSEPEETAQFLYSRGLRAVKTEVDK